VAFLNGTERDPRLHELVLALGGELLLLGGLASTRNRRMYSCSVRWTMVRPLSALPGWFMRWEDQRICCSSLTITCHGLPSSRPLYPGRWICPQMDTRSLGLAIIQLAGVAGNPAIRSITP